MIVSAEMWARQMDALAEDIIRELDERRRVDKQLDDAEYVARYQAHRNQWKHLRLVEPYAERRARELAAADRSAQARRQGREVES